MNKLFSCVTNFEYGSEGIYTEQYGEKNSTHFIKFSSYLFCHFLIYSEAVSIISNCPYLEYHQVFYVLGLRLALFMDVKASSVLKSKKKIYLCSEFLEAWRYNVILMSHSFCVALFTFSLLSHSDVHVKNVLKFVKMIRSEQNWNYDWFELATLEKYETFENFNTAPPLKMKAICWVIEKKT